MEAVRAAEMLVSNMTPKSPGPNRVDLKTTTIVMSKHTLAPQTSTVSRYFSCYVFLCVWNAIAVVRDVLVNVVVFQ